LKDNAETDGLLIVDNSGIPVGLDNPLLSALSSFKSITIRRQGRINVTPDDITSFTVTDSVLLLEASFLALDSGVTMTVSNATGFDIHVESGTLLELRSGSSLNANAVRVGGGTLNTHIDMSFPVGSDLELSDGATINVYDSTTFSLQFLDPTNIQSGSFNLTSGNVLSIASDRAVIGSDVTLIKDGVFGVPDQIAGILIDSGGVLTHSVRHLNGLVLSVADTLNIRSGGMIDLMAKGLRGGHSGSLFGRDGETYDSTDSIVAGAAGGQAAGNVCGAGASYGGWGAACWGPANPPYGLLEDPRHLGSGGGGADAGSRPGGHGGGLATITAGVCLVDGVIRANGGAGLGHNPQSGGGSGGSIRLNAGSLSGSGVIESKGGDGVEWQGMYLGSSGGGGRIAVYYDSLSFEDTSLSARGSSVGFNSSAGTIYLKDNAEAGGLLIVDNGHISVALATPLLSSVPDSTSIIVRDSASLQVTGSHTQTLGNITLDEGSLQADTVHISASASLSGNGIVVAVVDNEGLVAPGLSAGGLTIEGNYVQSSGGSLELELGGLLPVSEYDRLHVSGYASLAGTLDIQFVNGFNPIDGSMFEALLYDSAAGQFVLGNGIDSIMTAYYMSTSMMLVAGSDIVSNSYADPLMITSPAGNIPFSTILRDSQGLPIEGSGNVWLDFTGLSNVTPCGSVPRWPIITPENPSDANGMVIFSPKIGGCTSDSVAVMTSHGVIAKVPIKSLDHSGGLLVTASDFVGDDCNDYNDDGVVNDADWVFFEDYVGLSCLDNAANQVGLETYTVPGPHDIFQGDTVSICGQLVNTSGELILLDSVVFKTAGWGIARLWTTFASQQGLSLPGMDTITVCETFIVPEAQHGCFKVHIYPRYAAAPPPATSWMAQDNFISLPLGNFHASGETASEIVRALRQRYDVPINFIQANSELPLFFHVSEVTLVDLLDTIAASDPGYTTEIVDDRIILRAADTIYDALIESINITSMPRLAAAHQYLQTVKEQKPDLADLLLPRRLGRRLSATYMDRVTLDPASRALDHFVQLLGDNRSLSFSIEQTASGNPMFGFYRQQGFRSSAEGCESCRPTAINTANVNPFPCDSDSCGIDLLIDYTGITTECCPGQVDCDCSGGKMTEVVTTEGDCMVGSVETGEGCEIDSGGVMPECDDVFGLCLPPAGYPQDSCKWTLTQKLYVCDKLIQTVVIPFTVYNNGDSCWAPDPIRTPGPPLQPPPCDSTDTKERQINRDARKRQQEGAGAFSGGGQGPSGTTSFEIPIGVESGDSLYLYKFVFLPDGWSYTISDSGWIYTPDTISVEILHDDVIVVGDTGRVILYAYNDRDGFAGTAEVLVYEPGPPTSVDQVPEAGLPRTYELAQNYPNPFNPTTNIEFALPTSSDVSVEVVNILGQHVAELVNDLLPAGRYRLEWNGTDYAGNSVATGVYFYRIQAGDFVETRKMLLLK